MVGLVEVVAVAGDDFLDHLGEVVLPVPAIRHLRCCRCAGPGAFGVGTSPVAADDVDTRVGVQPVRDGARLDQCGVAAAIVDLVPQANQSPREGVYGLSSASTGPLSKSTSTSSNPLARWAVA